MAVIDYDTELRAHNERLRAAAAVGGADHVLDIGCGAGQTTREAARAAGDDTAAAMEFVGSFQSTRDALEGLPAAAAARALERLRDTLEGHRTADGIAFDSRAWIITARAGP